MEVIEEGIIRRTPCRSWKLDGAATCGRHSVTAGQKSIQGSERYHLELGMHSSSCDRWVIVTAFGGLV